MNRNPIVASATALVLSAVSLSAYAGAESEGGDCFPQCPPTVAIAETVEPAISACEFVLVRKADELNNQVKPLKEIVGYVRSPQGLAIKLVNDHVVKIPKWVGYAVDPVGSIRQRAMREVKGHAREALGMNRDRGCAAPEAVVVFEPADEI